MRDCFLAGTLSYVAGPCGLAPGHLLRHKVLDSLVGTQREDPQLVVKLLLQHTHTHTYSRLQLVGGRWTHARVAVGKVPAYTGGV